MNAIFDIPKHTRCQNCGKCCGVILVSEREVKAIQEYLKKNPKIRAQRGPDFTCPFRDEENRRCVIYPVRPTICRLMGVCDGLECPEGNSAHIDGLKFFDPGTDGDIRLLNALDWGYRGESHAETSV